MGPDDTAIRLWLDRQPSFTLADILASLSLGDERARRLIGLRLSADGPAPDVAVLRLLIEQAIVPVDRIRESGEYAHSRSTDDVIDALRALLGRGFAAEVRDLCVHAIACVDHACERLAEGWMLGQAYHQLVRLHVAACQGSPPRRDDLAAWLKQVTAAGYTDAVQEMRAEYEAIIRGG